MRIEVKHEALFKLTFNFVTHKGGCYRSSSLNDLKSSMKVSVGIGERLALFQHDDIRNSVGILSYSMLEAIRKGQERSGGPSKSTRTTYSMRNF